MRITYRVGVKFSERRHVFAVVGDMLLKEGMEREKKKTQNFGLELARLAGLGIAYGKFRVTWEAMWKISADILGAPLTLQNEYLPLRVPPFIMKKISWLPASLRGGLQCTQCLRPTPSNSFPRRQLVNQFSTSNKLQASIAAPGISFKNQGSEGDELVEEEVFNARLVPNSASYFTAQPIFTDDLLSLQNILKRYANLPVLKPGEAPRVAWRSLADYRNLVGETVKAAKYSKIIEVLHRLNHIHPSLMPKEVKEALNDYKRDVNPYQNKPKLGHVNTLGKALGVGRRKSSSAQAWVVDGTGEVLINGKTLTEAFGRIHDRESAIWALKCTNRVDKYNVWALVSGGGTTGQAEALTLAVGKALLAHEPALKPALRRGEHLLAYNSVYVAAALLCSSLTPFLAGCMTRDPKRVERKKPGHVKARKMPAWVKR